MSTATMVAAMASPPTDAAARDEWITLAEASRRLAAHPTSVQRAALAGRIRTRSGLVRTLYSAEDVRSLAG